MRVLLIGCTGQVGWELNRSLLPLGPVRAVDRRECDLAEPSILRQVVEETSPDIIVNAAAYTAVDKAESETDRARSVNELSVQILAEEASRLRASLIHYSTDYVFDGTKGEPYTEEDAPSPVSEYGRSKLAGERAIQESGVPHLILRTSWVYAARGQNFMRTMLRLMRDREELKVVADQHGSPTWARLIADVTAAILARAGSSGAEVRESLQERGGVFHLTATGATTWFHFAERIRDLSIDPERRLRVLRPIRTDEYPTAARRPLNSVLSTQKLRSTWGIGLPAWVECLRLCLAEPPTISMPAAEAT